MLLEELLLRTRNATIPTMHNLREFPDTNIMLIAPSLFKVPKVN